MYKEKLHFVHFVHVIVSRNLSHWASVAQWLEVPHMGCEPVLLAHLAFHPSETYVYRTAPLATALYPP